MLPLFDMMLKAQNGAAMDTLAKQFNLAQEQAAQAMAALMPAFSSGFKRTAANPYDFTSLMGGMSSGAYGQYFEDMSRAFTPQGMADGNAVLEKLFGSKEVSRAVAAQAAQLTGIGQEVVKRMMPAVADAIGQMTQQWLQAIGMAPKPQPQTSSIPFDNPMFQAMRSMWGLEKQAEPAKGTNPFADNPFTKAFQDMMTGAFQPQATNPAAAKAPEPKIEKPELDKFQSVMNTMFDSGVEVQKAYQKNMEAIFEGYTRSTTAETAKPASA